MFKTHSSISYKLNRNFFTFYTLKKTFINIEISYIMDVTATDSEKCYAGLNFACGLIVDSE